jgi:hypothetical protein
MEKLAYLILAAGIVGLCFLGGGAYLLHTAINLGDFFRGVVGVIALGVGFKLALPAMLMLGTAR